MLCNRPGGADDEDLIETLWNVKEDEVASYVEELLGFNRDIVECKEKLEKIALIKNERFNRDIVECKVLFFHCPNQITARFNRDIVECKGRYFNHTCPVIQI